MRLSGFAHSRRTLGLKTERAWIGRGLAQTAGREDNHLKLTNIGKTPGGTLSGPLVNGIRAFGCRDPRSCNRPLRTRSSLPAATLGPLGRLPRRRIRRVGSTRPVARRPSRGPGVPRGHRVWRRPDGLDSPKKRCRNRPAAQVEKNGLSIAQQGEYLMSRHEHTRLPDSWIPGRTHKPHICCEPHSANPLRVPSDTRCWSHSGCCPTPPGLSSRTRPETRRMRKKPNFGSW